MDIQTLKSVIESRSIPHQLMIFQYDDNTSYFLCLQYLKQIIKIRNQDVIYHQEIIELMYPTTSMFIDEDDIHILITESVDKYNEYLLNKQDTIIICKKIKQDFKDVLEDNIIHFPKILDWQLYDYVYSMVTGVSHEELDNFIESCHKNIFKIQHEIDKIILFPEGERKFIFQQFIDEGIFSDMSSKNMFDFTNAVLKKDVKLCNS